MFKLFDRMVCLISALVFSQVPRFIDLYTTRLSGHVAEASSIVGQYTDVAKRFGLTLDAYIGKFLTLQDPELRIQGQIMQHFVDRLASLSNSYHALVHAEWYQSPAYFLRYFDKEVVTGTWQHFSFGLNFTMQTTVWMGFGVVIALLVLKLGAFCFRSLMGSKNKEDRHQITIS